MQHPAQCTLAYWHQPLFSSGRHGGTRDAQPIWRALYQYGADVVLNAHDHIYERFAPQDPWGVADPAYGIRQFTVGTGGEGLYEIRDQKPNSEVRNKTTLGVLKLDLHAGGYDWQFIPVAGGTFTDSGSGTCVGAVPGGTLDGQAGQAPLEMRSPRASDLIFEDGFESGDVSTWPVQRAWGNALEVNHQAAMLGNQGLQVSIHGRKPAYLLDDSPFSETRYRMRFYFDPHSIWMRPGDSHVIFAGLAGMGRQVLKIELRPAAGAYEIRASLRSDAWWSWRSTRWCPIADEAHVIELEWHAASSKRVHDGGLAWWVDGVLREIVTGVNNDAQRIDRVQLGAVSGIDSGTSGSYYFDAFESRRDGYIGPGER